ncbi:hypothetical protein GQ367_02630 [Polynucleobacter sp. MWH-CaK5]|nr:hypothetical protein [Polynucleobacter sp. MWH-CaK5]QWD89382.1 hypothetical protein GQ367_02630 [Polynucleobacter sp. MWH-CaK5]
MADWLEFPPLRLAQDAKKMAEAPPSISLENLCVSDVVLFKSDMSLVL